MQRNLYWRYPSMALSDASVNGPMATLLRYERMRQAAYLYVHRTLAKEIAITKEQVAGRMRQRFPDCPDSEIELAVNDVFQAFIAKKAASVGGARRRTEMDCRERERLDSALNAVVNRRDRLNKVSRDDPNFGQHKQEIEELSKQVDQAHQDLQAHKDWHGCS